MTRQELQEFYKNHYCKAKRTATPPISQQQVISELYTKKEYEWYLQVKEQIRNGGSSTDYSKEDCIKFWEMVEIFSHFTGSL